MIIRSLYTLLLTILIFQASIFLFSSPSPFSKKNNTPVQESASDTKEKIQTKKTEKKEVAGIKITALTPSNIPVFNSVSTSIDSTSSNLIRNSSFETESSGQPRGWYYLLDSTTGNTFISPEGIRSGNFGLKFAGTAPGNFGIMQPDLKTVPGRTYTLSAYIKQVNTPSITFRFGLWNEYLNKEGPVKNLSLSTGTKDWTRVSFTTTTPGLITDPKNMFPILEVFGLSSGSVYIDDIQLEEGSSPSVYNSAQAKPSAISGVGDGSIIFSPGGDIYPNYSGLGSLGSSTNKFQSLTLSNAKIDKDGNLTVNGSEIKGTLTLNGNLSLKSGAVITLPSLSGGILHSDSSGSISASSINLANSDVTGTLPVGSGGTGTSSLTQYGILYGNGTGAISALTPGTSGYVLQSNGTSSAPSWVPAGGGSSAFSAITAGTNTSAAMVIGSGASLTYSGGTASSGVINTNQLLGNTWASPGSIGITTPNTASFTTLSASSLDINGNLLIQGGGTIDTRSSGTLAIGNTTATTITLGRSSQGITIPGFDCSAQTNGGALTTTAGGVLTCSADDSGSTSNWRLTNGALSPINDTLDLLIGNSSTSSAKFAFLNVNSGTPTASISANSGDNAVYINGLGNIGTTNRQTLTLGNSSTYNSTGNILLNPNGTGNVYLGSNSQTGGNPNLYFYGYDSGEAVAKSARVFINSNGTFNIEGPGTDYFNIENNSDLLTLQYNAGNDLTAFNDSATGENKLFRIYGYQSQTGDTGSKYGYLKFADGGAGAAGYLQLGVQDSDQNIILTPGSSVGINTTSPLAKLDVRGAGSATSPIASLSGSTTFAGLVVDNSGSGDLFTASSSGATKFTILNNGNLSFAGSTNFLSTLASAATDIRTWTLPDASGTLCLQNSSSCGFATGTNYWQSANAGTIAPYNNTVDLLIGGTSTSSAKFAFLNVAGGTPTASISANSGNNALFIDGLGNIGTTNRQTLTLGNSSTYNSTGNILLNPNGTGNVGIGTTAPLAKLDVNGNLRVTGFHTDTPTATTSNAGLMSTSDKTKVSRWIDAKADYSINCDGTDETAKFQTLISNITSGTTVVFPAGTCGYSSELTVGNGTNSSQGTIHNILLLGQGGSYYFSSGTIFKWLGGASSGTMLTLAGNADQLSIKGITFDANNAIANGVTVYSDHYGSLEDIGILNFTNTGLSLLTRVGSLPSHWTNYLTVKGFFIISQNNGITGLLVDGDYAGNADNWQNSFRDGIIQVPNASTGTNYAAHFKFTDSSLFENVELNTYGAGNGYAAWFDGTDNANYPQNLSFLNSSINSTKVTGTIGKNQFYGFKTRDSETIPTDSNLIGYTDTGQVFNGGISIVQGAVTGKALMSLNETGNQDIFTASASGATKFVITNGGLVGIGTTNPGAPIEAVSSSPQIRSTGYAGFGIFGARGAQGTEAVPAALNSGNTLGFYGFYGYGTNAWAGSATAAIYATAEDSFNNTSMGTNLMLATTPRGSVTRAERLRIVSEGYVGINVSSPSAVLDVRGVGINTFSGTIPVASISGSTTFAAMVVDNNGTGDLFTASKSGASKFTILNNGNIQINNLSTGLTYSTNGLLSSLTPGNGIEISGSTLQHVDTSTQASSDNSNGVVIQDIGLDTYGHLTSLATVDFDTRYVQSGGTGSSKWTEGAGALYPNITTRDLLLGGTSTASALFRVAGTTGAVTANTYNGIVIATSSGTLNMGGYNLTISGTSSLNQALTTASAPSFSGLTLSGFTSNGGPLYTNGSGVLSQTTAGTATQILHGGTAPSFSAVSLTADVTGVLPIANGGTNKNLTLSNGGIVWSDADSFEILSANANSGLALVSGGAGAPSWFTPTTGSVIFAGANGALSQNNASFFWDNTNNRLGIGANSSLLSTLDVRGNSATIPAASISANSTFAAMVVDNSGSGDLFTASSSGLPRFTIRQNGNVGIGTTSPKSLLDINGTVNATKVYSGSAATAFGDSITVGVGASEPSKNYVSLIGSDTGWTMTNAGVSGSEMGNTAYTVISSATSTSSGRSIFLSGYNDMRHYGSSSAGQQTFADAYRTALIWMAIPDSQKIIANNASVTKTGTWATAANYSSFNGLGLSEYSSTINDTAEVTLYGTAVYIGFTYRTNLGSGGTFEILVDGVSYGITDEMAGVSPVDTPSYWPGAIRIGGLSPGPHQVVFKVKSAAATNVDWFASNDQFSGSAGPFVYAGGTLRTNAAGYASAAPWNNGSDAVVEQFNQIERQIVSQLITDGLKVVYVDVNKYYNANTADLGADNIHPSDQGYSHIANAFLDSMNSLTNPFERGGSFYASQLASYIQPYNGNIGIGTTTPSNLLEVNKSTTGGTSLLVKNPTAGTGNYGNLQVDSDTVATQFLSFSSTWTTNGHNVQSGTTLATNGVGGMSVSAYNAAGVLRFYTGGYAVSNERMRIDASGNIGIGTTAPSRLLDIAGNLVNNGTGTASQLSLRGTANTTNKLNIGYNTTSNFGFIEAVNENTAWQNLALQPSGGNVGIGIEAPGAKLEVNGIIRGQYGVLLESGNYTYKTVLENTWSAGLGRDILNFYTAGASADNASSKMTIVSSGSVGIGTTSPLAKLDVRGAATATSPIASLSGSTTFAGLVVDNSGSGDLFTASKSGAVKFIVANNGNVTINGSGVTGCILGNGTGATSCTASDRRLKDNITPLSEIKGLDAVRLLNPVSYKWNSFMQSNGATASDQFGFIAQDVASVFPNLVEQDKNTGYYKLDYQGFFAPLVKSIQELDVEVNNSGDLISSLALRVDALEQQATASASASQSAALANDVNSQLSTLQSQVNSLSAEALAKADQFSSLQSQIASLSGSLIPISPIPSLATSGAQLTLDTLDVKDATISGTLAVTGRTLLSDVGITGTINAGNLAINGLDNSCHSPEQGNPGDCSAFASLNTNAGALRLQSHGLYGLDILDGKVTITENGDIKTQGNITAKEVAAETFKVLGSKSAGNAVLPAGQTEVEITAVVATNSAKILLTPTTLTDKILTIIEKGLGKFRVGIVSPASSDIKFDWFIIQ